MYKKKIEHTKFILIKEDPLKLPVDALVNWTVTSLTQGDELFVRIHKEGGSLIAKEIIKIKGLAAQKSLPMSQVLITNAGILQAKRLLHAILPDYRIAKEKEAKESHLSNTINNIFYFIETHKQDFESIRTIAFTPIPTKIYGKLTPKSVPLFIETIKTQALRLKIREVYIICSEEDYKLYQEEFDKQTSSRWDRLLRFLGF